MGWDLSTSSECVSELVIAATAIPVFLFSSLYALVMTIKLGKRWWRLRSLVYFWTILSSFQIFLVSTLMCTIPDEKGNPAAHDGKDMGPIAAFTILLQNISRSCVSECFLSVFFYWLQLHVKTYDSTTHVWSSGRALNYAHVSCALVFIFIPNVVIACLCIAGKITFIVNLLFSAYFHILFSFALLVAVLFFGYRLEREVKVASKMFRMRGDARTAQAGKAVQKVRGITIVLSMVTVMFAVLYIVQSDKENLSNSEKNGLLLFEFCGLTLMSLTALCILFFENPNRKRPQSPGARKHSRMSDLARALISEAEVEPEGSSTSSSELIPHHSPSSSSDPVPVPPFNAGPYHSTGMVMDSGIGAGAGAGAGAGVGYSSGASFVSPA
eukprot:ANDGO_03555.mRNA.1 hypothetical protein